VIAGSGATERFAYETQGRERVALEKSDFRKVSGNDRNGPIGARSLKDLIRLCEAFSRAGVIAPEQTRLRELADNVSQQFRCALLGARCRQHLFEPLLAFDQTTEMYFGARGPAFRRRSAQWLPSRQSPHERGN
jgi:hypothetical protein